MEQTEKQVRISLGDVPSALIKLGALALVVFLGVRAFVDLKMARNMYPTNVISVSAEGRVFAKPDIGLINLAVMHEAKTVADAQKQVTDASNKLFEFLKSAGVDAKDIKTSHYAISPQYDYIQDKGQVLRGYQVSQGLDVKIRDTAKAGEIIAGAASAGANQVGSLQFTIDDPEKLKEQARADAIKRAKEKAQVLERELDVEFGDLISFSDSDGGGMPPPMYRAEVMGMGGAYDKMSAPSVPTGENEIVLNVVLTY